MQKKLTVRDGLTRPYVVTNIVAGKPEQVKFRIHPDMSDMDIKKAVQKGVPVELFEPMKGFEEEYTKLKRLSATLDVSKKKLSTSVRSKLVGMDGAPVDLTASAGGDTAELEALRKELKATKAAKTKAENALAKVKDK